MTSVSDARPSLPEAESRSNGRLHPATAASLAVVIPTRNEVENIRPLLDELDAVLPEETEIIFVDDSTDETPARSRSNAPAGPGPSHSCTAPRERAVTALRAPLPMACGWRWPIGCACSMRTFSTRRGSYRECSSGRRQAEWM
jgi:Glycosyltransferases involved in cell wall biogenesis